MRVAFKPFQLGMVDPTTMVGISTTMARWTLLLTLIVLYLTRLSEACTCMPAHPQTHYCKADYVLLAKVQDGVISKNKLEIAYHIKVRKTFKITDKAAVALKQGLIHSAVHGSLCGVSLKNNTKYLLAGSVFSGKLRISHCDFAEPWSVVTRKQKKGFRLLYKQGCECKISQDVWYPQRKPNNANTCTWNLWRDPFWRNCEKEHSVCMRQVDGSCDWNKSRSYRECVKSKKEERELELAREP